MEPFHYAPQYLFPDPSVIWISHLYQGHFIVEFYFLDSTEDTL